MASQTFKYGIRVEKVVSGRTGAARGWAVYQGEETLPREVKSTKQAATRCAEHLERIAAATEASLLAKFPVSELPSPRPNACAETDPRFLMLNALKVFTLDPNIRTFLEETDPQALKQARKAIEAFENREIPLFAGAKLRIRWDRSCGCRMCPCSPGYVVELVDRSCVSKLNIWT